MKAADRSFITIKVEEVLVAFGKSRLMTMAVACSSTETASVKLDDPAPLLSDSISEGGDDKDGGNEKQIRNLQILIHQSAGCVPALQQIQLTCEKPG